MVNTRVSDLAAGGAFAGTDLFYVVETPGAGGVQKTGTQLVEFIQDTVNATLVGGSNISVTYNDPANTITIAYTGPPPPADTDDLPEGAVNLYFTDARAIAAVGPVREQLTANRSYFVNPATGNDSNDGLTALTAFLTLARAEAVVQTIDGAGFNVTIELAAGSAGGVTVRQPLGIGVLTINGVGATSVIGSGATGIITRCLPGQLRIQNCATNATSNDIDANGGAITIGAGVTLTGSGTLVNSRNGGSVVADVGITLTVATGSAQYLFRAQTQGAVNFFNTTIDHSVVITYLVQTVSCRTQGFVNVPVVTWTNPLNVTGVRFVTELLGLIQTNGGGVNYIPGTIAGTEDATTFGVYN